MKDSMDTSRAPFRISDRELYELFEAQLRANRAKAKRDLLRCWGRLTTAGRLQRACRFFRLCWKDHRQSLKPLGIEEDFND